MGITFPKTATRFDFDKNDPDLIENSENEDCNKILQQKNARPSQNKSHDK